MIKFQKKHPSKKDLLIVLVLYTTTLIVRLINLKNASIYADEITWTVRGKELIYALLHKNFYFLENAWWNKTNDTEAIALPLVFINGLFQFFLSGQGKYSLRILNDIIASRLPVVIISSTLPALIYITISKILSKKVAILSALTYSLNPISISFDRMSINDSFLTLFSFLSLVSYIYYSEKQKISLIPSISLTLGFLTKPNGLLPIIGWTVYLIISKNKKFSIKQLGVNILSFFVLTTIIWPRSWEKPTIAIFEYLHRQITLVQEGMTVFYKGESTSKPGLDFYFIQYLIRTPEISIIGFLVALIVVIKKTFNKTRSFNKILLPILAYNIIFLLLITISHKKLGIRYSLPLLPWFVIASSWGIIKILQHTKKSILRMFAYTAIILGLIYPLSYHPELYFYYNTLVGGPKGAQRYDMVGFCASTRLATEYLNKIKNDGKVFVIGCPEPIRYYQPRFNITYNYLESDYIIVESYFIDQHPKDKILEYLKDKQLIKEIKFKGAIIAKIYKI